MCHHCWRPEHDETSYKEAEKHGYCLLKRPAMFEPNSTEPVVTPTFQFLPDVDGQDYVEPNTVNRLINAVPMRLLEIVRNST